MAEYTNLLSQFNTVMTIFNSIDSDENEKHHKAKFVPVVFYILCTLASFILAIDYFQNVKGFSKYTMIFLAVVFNIPFLLFYSIVYVHNKGQKPGLANAVQ